MCRQAQAAITERQQCCSEDSPSPSSSSGTGASESAASTCSASGEEDWSDSSSDEADGESSLNNESTETLLRDPRVMTCLRSNNPFELLLGVLLLYLLLDWLT